MTMTNLVILPILIPIFTGIILIFLRNQIIVQRWISALSLVAVVIVSAYMVQRVHMNGIQALHLGGWAPPYGIVLVADMFAALLVLTTSVVGLVCLWFAFHSIGKDREEYFFYPFFQFLLAGVCGSFLTGDIFNLFVFFEVMLISSYVLIVHGGTKPQLRESIKYLLINIVSSVFFVVAVAYLYSVTGTLNMAHLSLRVAEMGQEGILTVISLLFLIVFSLKASLFLYFWLPGAYSAPPTVIAAIFSALLTKVGIYALFRTFTLIFYHQPHITHEILAWFAALTMLLGVIGAVAYADVRKIITYNVIAAVGFIVFGLAIFSTVSLEGAIFYLIHDMIVKALLFLAAGLLISAAGTGQLRKMGGMIRTHPVLGWILFATGISLAGIPPLSGFIGKLLIIQGGFNQGFYLFVGVSLLSSLLILYSLMKLFMNAFWREPEDSRDVSTYKSTSAVLIAPCAVLLGLSVIIGLGAEWIYPYVSQAAETLMDPSIYIEAVGLKE
jgi:multicomponent Na+:H+ antiporter subunit D